MRASSVSESQSKTWMAPLLEPAAMVEPSAVQARERSRPATRLKLRRWARPEPSSAAGDEGEQSDASVVAGDGDALGGAAARGGLGGHGPDGAAVGVGGAARAEGVEVPLRDLAVEAGGEEAARRGLRAAAASPVSVVREREGRAPRQGRHRGALAAGHACRASPVGGVVNLEVACLARERDGQAPGATASATTAAGCHSTNRDLCSSSTIGLAGRLSPVEGGGVRRRCRSASFPRMSEKTASVDRASPRLALG